MFKAEVISLYEVEYYVENDYCPVSEFISNQSPKVQAKILREIDLLQEFGFYLGMPYIRKIQGDKDLWELRIKHSSNIFRVFYFCFTGGKFVLLHAIKKTTEKTPKNDLHIALARKARYLERRE